jgi:hypothetical protein
MVMSMAGGAALAVAAGTGISAVIARPLLSNTANCALFTDKTMAMPTGMRMLCLRPAAVRAVSGMR